MYRTLWKILLLITLAGCSQADQLAPTEIAATEIPLATPAAVTGLAPVDSVQLRLIETMPVGVELFVQGNLPDGCTQIDAVTQTRNEQRIEITITTRREADAVCTQALVPFEETIAVDADGLPAGSYTVDINGVQSSFVFGMDNIAPETPTTVPTAEPTADPVESGFEISGLVFHDVCAIAGGEGGEPTVPSEGCVERMDGGFVANGTLEAGEPPLVGVVVKLFEADCLVEVASADSDSSGGYVFSNIANGSYCLTIVPTDEPNASILIPGEFTTPDATGQQLVTVSGSVIAAPFGWDFQFLPVPETEQSDTLVAANCGDRVSFWGDVTVPDDTPFEPGAPVVKTWRLINTGGCTWNTEYGLQFAGGEQMEAPDFVPLDRLVPPGGEIDVTVRLKAPETLGTYRSDWLFRNDNGELFGLGDDIENVIFLQIEIVDAGTLGQISGFVWSDLCDQSAYLFGQPTLPPGCLQNENGTVRGDGVFDVSAELRLAGVTMSLGSGECGDAELITTTVSDADGIYRFASLPSATYCIYVDVVTEDNFALLVPGLMTAPQVGRTGFTVTLQPDQELTTLNFGWDFTEQ